MYIEVITYNLLCKTEPMQSMRCRERESERDRVKRKEKRYMATDDFLIHSDRLNLYAYAY